jgi:molybdopterin-guanine dinucleotide biosynthesis protein A
VLNRMTPSRPAKAVAVLLAGGKSTGSGNTRYKALVPVQGKPVAGYVLHSLSKSEVEKIFVVHDAAIELDNTIGDHPKACFSPVKADPSLGSSVLTGLQRIAESYRGDELNNLRILFSPCDITLATPEDFNFLIESSLKMEEDILIPYINQAFLTRTYPGKHFISFFLSDKGGRYAPQPVWIGSGRAFARIIDRNYFKANGTGGWSLINKDALKLYKLCESLIDDRKSRLNLLRILSSLTIRLVSTRHFACSWRLFISILKKRYSLNQAGEVLNCLTGFSFKFVESRRVELSGDVDTAEDQISIPKMIKNKEPVSPELAMSDQKE